MLKSIKVQSHQKGRQQTLPLITRNFSSSSALVKLVSTFQNIDSPKSFLMQGCQTALAVLLPMLYGRMAGDNLAIISDSACPKLQLTLGKHF